LRILKKAIFKALKASKKTAEAFFEAWGKVFFSQRPLRRPQRPQKDPEAGQGLQAAVPLVNYGRKGGVRKSLYINVGESAPDPYVRRKKSPLGEGALKEKVRILQTNFCGSSLEAQGDKLG
jgi:hypothetical protein